MKILSKQEVIIELNEILNYNISDIKVDTKEIETASSYILSMVECLNISNELNDIILDIEDINHIINNKDLLIMSAFEYRGNNALREAMKLTVKDIENNKLLLINADGILVYFQVNSDYPMMKLSKAMDVINRQWYEKFIINEPDVIFGISCNNDLENDYVKITIFASFSKKEDFSYINNLIPLSLV